jgi:hypothetical protein|tara:strand:- start:378 stop:806 length:429 start_codon:yes stop_codon:yes gene_type:complete
MSTNLEKTLLQLGCTKSDNCNVDSDITTFSIINSSNLESSTTSAQAENEYLNSVEWKKPDGTITMTPSEFVLDYSVVGPVLELMMLREERNKKLAATDWIVTKAFETGGGVPESWKNYRQALRDITLSTQSIFSVTWPTEPN